MQETQPFRLAAIDVDGTLVGPDLIVSDANANAIRQLREAGIAILLASGRSHANILPFYDQLGADGLVVSVHGAVVRDSATGNYLLEEPLSRDAVQQITAEGRARGISLLHYRRAGVFIERTSELTEYEQSRNFEPQTLVGDLLEDPTAAVHKLVWLHRPKEIRALTPVIARRFEGIATVTHTDPEYLEFTASHANKANGVAAVVQRMGITPEQVVAFGDANNDIPLLAWAGLGIAMPHASSGAKAAADIIGPDAPLEVAFARAVHSVTAIQKQSPA